MSHTIHFTSIFALLIALTACGGGGGGGGSGGGGGGGGGGDVTSIESASGGWTFDYISDELPDQTFLIIKDGSIGGNYIMSFSGLVGHQGVSIDSSGYVYSFTSDATTSTWTITSMTNTTCTGIYSSSSSMATAAFVGTKTYGPDAVNDTFIGNYITSSYGELEDDPNFVIAKVGPDYTFDIEDDLIVPSTITVTSEDVLSVDHGGVRYLMFRESDGTMNMYRIGTIVSPEADDVISMVAIRHGNS